MSEANKADLEAIVDGAVEVLRQRGRDVVVVTEAAVVDADADGDGRLDENPDTGAGARPGVKVVTVDGRHRLTESDFAGCASVAEAVAFAEAALAEGRFVR